MTNPTQLSDNFIYTEAIESATATANRIDNTPPNDVLIVMIKTALYMEKVRALLKQPIHVNSWYRCTKLNIAVGSHSTSQHLKGEAVDFTSANYGTPLDICKTLVQYQDLIPFDQLILEHSWVHVSFAILTAHPRGEVLSLLATGGYAKGLTDTQGRSLV